MHTLNYVTLCFGRVAWKSTQIKVGFVFSGLEELLGILARESGFGEQLESADCERSLRLLGLK